MKKHIAFALGAFLAATLTGYAAEVPSGLVYTPAMKDTIVKPNAQSVKVQTNPDALIVDLTQGKGYPGVFLAAPDGYWNLAAYNALEVTLKNTGSSSVRVAAKIQNKEDWRKNNAAQKRFAAGETGTIVLRFGYNNGYPAAALDLSRISSLAVFITGEGNPAQLSILSIRAVNLTTPAPTVAARVVPGKKVVTVSDGKVFVPGQPETTVVPTTGTVSAKVSDGALVLDIPAGKGYPGVRILPTGGMWNFTGYNALSFVLRNSGKTSLRVAVKAENPGDWKKNNTEQKRIEPGKTETIRLFFGYSYGNQSAALDIARIAPLTVFVSGVQKDSRLSLLSITAENAKLPVSASFSGASAAAAKTVSVTDGRVYTPGISGIDVLPTHDTVQPKVASDALVVEIAEGKSYPGIRLRPAGGVWDVSQYEYLDFEIANTGRASIRIAAKIENPGDWKKSRTELKRILPGKAETIRVRFAAPTGSSAAALDLKRISPITLFLDGKFDGGAQFSLRSIRAGKSAAQTGETFPNAGGALLKITPKLDLFDISRTNASLALIDGNALKITTFAGFDWPGIHIPAPNGKWDLSAYEYIALDLQNIDNHDIDLYVRINNPGADGRTNSMTERVGIQPNQRTTMTIPIKRNANSPLKLFNMIGRPNGLYDGKGINPANVSSLTIFTGKKAPFDHNVKISNLRAFGRYQAPAWLAMTQEQFFPFIDCYGQFIHKDWPGKIHSDAELKKNIAVEDEWIAKHGTRSDWSRFGGWAAGPKLEATGHFRTAKHDGKWYLVDPDGYLFFSAGMNVVSLDFGATPVNRREHYFQNLPTSSDFRYRHAKIWSGDYAGQTPDAYNFSGSNLKRKYGEDWKNIAIGRIHRRLRAWGINTIGNWSGKEVMARGGTPYTTTAWHDSKKIGKARFPDMFDSAFASSLESSLRHWRKDCFEDPWCIGFFIDNEMPWGGSRTLAEYALKAPQSQPAKQEFLRYLQQKYSSVEEFNRAWNQKLNAWDDFLTRREWTASSDAAFADQERFTGVMAEQYFRTVREVIKKCAPNKLYLGCRCVGGSANVIAAAAKYCDVISYNLYCASVRDIRVPDGIDHPVIVGEFHFGATDRGPVWGGLFSAVDQKDRAEKYRHYLASALDNPQIVGVHWFQYGDEPFTGRADGENAQCGFVDVADTPYWETVEASSAVGDSMYRVRAGK